MNELSMSDEVDSLIRNTLAPLRKLESHLQFTLSPHGSHKSHEQLEKASEELQEKHKELIQRMKCEMKIENGNSKK